jgi:peptidoglycan/xylan/chitin deacetylase (PgdA/CDA1 family)
MSTESFNDKIVLSSEVRLAIFLVIAATVMFLLTGAWTKPAIKVAPVVISEALPLRAASDKEIVHGDISKRQVIFTFDGGDGAQSTVKILQTLAKHHVKGSFFLTGKFVEANQDLVRSITLLGNEIYSHTYDHPHLTALTDEEITKEMKKTEEIFKKVMGVDPKPYFRAPYGERNSRVIKEEFKDGYQSVYWTVDALDWEQPNGRTAKEVKDKIMMNLAPGNIYLMHLGDTITGEILDDVFTEIESKGYKIVSLKEGIL